MKNDPIIHAPLSKIVEAINNSLNTMSPPYTKSQTLKLVTEALASLGGEEKCKDCNDSGQVPIGEEQGYILYSDCPCQTPHASEREVLEGFVEWINKTMHPFHFSKEIINRYLAEKQSKTE